MATPTIINNPPSSANDSQRNNSNFLLNVILLILVVIALLYFGLPLINRLVRPASTPNQINVPDKIDVNVNQDGQGQ